jgi:ParB family transcriptional regulator, chromosome partitioning protein
LASEEGEVTAAAGSDGAVQRAVTTIGSAPTGSDADTSDEDDTIRSLSDRLVTELTAHRTLALRDALANDPHVAFQAVLHALCLNAFYRYASDTCLEITAKHSGFSAQAPGLAETASAKAIEARHAQWARQLPETPADVWDALTAFDGDSQTALLAHCASLAVNVVKEPWNRRPGAFAHGDLLVRAVNLDMAAAGWRPTVDNYLDRVPKARILEAVREAKGEPSAQLIDHLKKADMAKEAERLLEGTG